MSAAPQPKAPRDPLPWLYWIPFTIGVLLIALWMAHKPPPARPQTTLPVLARPAPAYHLIAPGDVITTTVDSSRVMTDTLRDASKFAAHYARDPLPAGQPIREGQLAALPTRASQSGAAPRTDLISNTLAVAVPATSATILGGNLRAGDIVSLATVPLSDTISLPTVLFSETLVLDVKASASGPIVVLAIPEPRWLDYLTRTRGAAVVLARRVE